MKKKERSLQDVKPNYRDSVNSSKNFKVILAGRSQSTFTSYLRAIAQISLHYNCLPLALSDEQINAYLTLHKTGQLDRLKPSEGYFKPACSKAGTQSLD